MVSGKQKHCNELLEKYVFKLAEMEDNEKLIKDLIEEYNKYGAFDLAKMENDGIISIRK